MAPLRFRRLAAFAVLAAACGGAGATTVYKCFDRSLGVLYTDQPCRGEQLDIRAGDPDPVAVAELQRERDALSRSTAQRLADNRRVAAAYDAPVVTYMPPPDATPYPYADYAAPGYYGNAPYAYAARGARRDGRGSGARTERGPTVPNGPPGLPRR